MAAMDSKNDGGSGTVLDFSASRTWLESDNVLCSLQDENRSLKIKIAGVDTLSSLLRGTRDELETVCAEKESLEVELARLQCRCSLLETDLTAAKKASQTATGHSNSMFEALLKENKRLKNELKSAKDVRSHQENIFGSAAMTELLAFKGELETEIKGLQKAMSSHEEESSISQVSRLLGQVTKLEYQLKTKEDECKVLITEVNSLKSQIESDSQSTEKDDDLPNGSKGIVQDSKIDFGLQVGNEVVIASTQTEFEENCQLTILEADANDTKHKNSLSSDVVLRKTTSLKRRNSRCASGDWSQIRKVHSGLFEDEWNFDAINANEQLKITQDLLVQANEIIMIMTEENEKLLKANAMLLQDIAQGESIQLSEKEKVLDRFRFLFGESSFGENFDDIEAIQDILIKGDLHPGSTGGKETIQETYFGEELAEDADHQNNNIKQPEIAKKEYSNENGLHGGDDLEKIEKDECERQQNLQTRDSGVDICITDHEKQSELKSSSTDNKVTSNNKDSERVDSLIVENSKLTIEVESQSKKLREAVEKISELEEALKTIKEKEKQWKEALVAQKADTPNQRLSKSIGHIPTSVRNTTYQRVIFESDV